ncbi:hypothetical protein FACS1894179_06690 [Bacteroidia bacterium]|nr:hypothetical protein FACS1894169_10590 [Bacteroidia bacterium]GHV40331.1 hypothetical protein FACS1894179_06690 [Bacteroidia bacterium]
MIEPLISVVIPVYNRPDTLKRTLDSVVKQTYFNLEIFVVDDGSDLDIYPIIDELKDNRIFYHKLEHKNANVARNYGIEKSKGRYIAMLDADDLWLESHIEECLKTLQFSQADGLYGSLILKNINTGQERIASVRYLHKDETMIDYLLSMGYGAQTSTLFMTAESAESILWNPVLNRHQDYDFVVRYSKQYRLIPKTEPTVIYLLGESKELNIDFNSCIQVIRENEEDISPNLYTSYNMNMLLLARRQNAPIEIIEHYKKEATYYKEYISFYQFLIIKQPQTEEEQLKCKDEYISYISEIQLE